MATLKLKRVGMKTINFKIPPELLDRLIIYVNSTPEHNMAMTIRDIINKHLAKTEADKEAIKASPPPPRPGYR